MKDQSDGFHLGTHDADAAQKRKQTRQAARVFAVRGTDDTADRFGVGESPHSGDEPFTDEDHTDPESAQTEGGADAVFKRGGGVARGIPAADKGSG